MKLSQGTVGAVLAGAAAATVVVSAAPKEGSSTLRGIINESKQSAEAAAASPSFRSFAHAKVSDVYQRLKRQVHLRNEVRDESNRLTNSYDEEEGSSSSSSTCSPAVVVTGPESKIDAGLLPEVSSCGSGSVCLSVEENPSREGTCVAVEDIPESYWEYGSSSVAAATIPDSYWSASAERQRGLMPLDAQDGQCDALCLGSSRPVIPSTADMFYVVDSCINNETGAYTPDTCNYATPLNCWNTAAVTDFDFALAYKGFFNEALNCWDTSSATSMSAMFYKASKFNKPLDKWNVAKNKYFDYMFDQAQVFDEDIQDWNTQSAENMTAMFYAAYAFNQYIKNWSTGSVEDMRFMFAYNYGFNEDIDSWNVQNVKNMSGMFFSAKEFDRPLSNWDTSSVEDMSSMFNIALEFDQDINGWATGKVTSMANMFAGFYDYTNYNADGSTINPDEFGVMTFNRDVDGWDVEKVKDFKGMFYSSYFNQDLENWVTKVATDMSMMFMRSSMDGIVDKFKLDKVVNTSAMFYYSNIGYRETADIYAENPSTKPKHKFGKKWKTGKVVDMSDMFSLAYFMDSDVNKWDTKNVESMYAMFYGAERFTGGLKKWNVKSCTNFASMFEEAKVFNDKIDSWNIFSAIYMDYMLANATNFDQCLSSWDYKAPAGANITNMLVLTSCAEIYPERNTSPWCQAASNKCKAYSPRGQCENSAYFVTGKKDDCVKTFERDLGPDFAPTPDELKKQCDKVRGTTRHPNKLNGTVFCPATCQPDLCCGNDESTVFVTDEGNKNGCTALFNSVKRSDINKKCKEAIQVSGGGTVKPKDVCNEFCFPGCILPVSCQDDNDVTIQTKVLDPSTGTKIWQGNYAGCDGLFSAFPDFKCSAKIKADGKPSKPKKICPGYCDKLCQA